MQKPWVPSLGWENPLEKEMATHSSTLDGKFHGWRSLVGYSSWDRKELDMTKQLYWLVPSTEQASFNFVIAVTVCSDFEAQENKICHCFHFFTFYLP